MLRSKLFLFFAFILVFALGLFYFLASTRTTPAYEQQASAQNRNEALENNLPDKKLIKENEDKDDVVLAIETTAFLAPMDRAPGRITKKSFGMFITPETSPVEDDKFRGYHTGTDFEIFSEELAIDVPVRAVCGGNLTLKKTASGYGGVVVQECEFDSEPVTVIYGHMKLESVSKSEGKKIAGGEVIGLLGNDKSFQTDGARKHLHLSVHRGKDTNIKGYITSKQGLSDWIDPCLLGCCKP